MEIILVQDVASLGLAGQKVSVKDGYARNHLIPMGLAVTAGPGAGSAAQARRGAQLRSAEAARKKAEEFGRRLAQTICKIPVSVGEQGKLHGAVTAADIAEALQKQGIVLEKHQIQMERSLSQLGEHEVPVRLHPDVKVTLRVTLCQP